MYSQLRFEVIPHSQIIELNAVSELSTEALSPQTLVELDSKDLVEGSTGSQFSEGQSDVADYVISNFALERVSDIYKALERLKHFGNPRGRFVFLSYSRLYLPIIWLLEAVGLKDRDKHGNYISPRMLRALLNTAGLEICKERAIVLVPFSKGGPITDFVNGVLAKLPLLSIFAMGRITIARRLPRLDSASKDGITIIIPARNESGHLEELVRRLPLLSHDQEVIFVEGGSSDDTWLRILDLVAENEKNLRTGQSYRALQQQGRGKADAVRLGIEAGKNELIVILDADISVSPEDLVNFVNPIRAGVCEFANGSRMVYGMEKGAMRLLNLIGNRIFAGLVGFLTDYRLSDVLCGTKVFLKSDYLRAMGANRVVAKQDPFGDFEFLFAASRLGLAVRDIPVRYHARTYGSTNISRFRDGGRLLLALAREAIGRRERAYSKF